MSYYLRVQLTIIYYTHAVVYRYIIYYNNNIPTLWYPAVPGIILVSDDCVSEDFLRTVKAVVIFDQSGRRTTYFLIFIITMHTQCKCAYMLYFCYVLRLELPIPAADVYMLQYFEATWNHLEILQKMSSKARLHTTVHYNY